MRRAADIVGVIEAAYRVEQPEQSWLASVLEASRPLVDCGLGMLGAVYDVSNITAPDASSAKAFDLPETVETETMREAFQGLSPECVERLITTTGCHVIPWDRRFSENPGTPGLASLPVVPSPFGASDMMVINAADPTGRGCFISVNLPRRNTATRASRSQWDRLAAHLCAGLRLARKLAAAGDRANAVEAVVAVDGRIEHAEEAAKSVAAREALRLAARSQERARGSLRRRAPDEALEEWKGLVAARWTLREQFDHDGRRYLLAEQNAPPTSYWIATLTDRERQVVAYASLGQHNKLIAYNLGISHSTVRVLLARAAMKANVRTRAELVESFQRARLEASPSSREP